MLLSIKLGTLATSELLRIFREKQARGKPEDAYWGCKDEPTRSEVEVAISSGNLTAWHPGDDACPAVQGNRKWHVGRIAWFVLNWSDDYPVRVSADRRDIDGGHRVYAALIRGIETLRVTKL